ncbi:MAG: MFS transporter [Acidobacteriota bacterium]|nr:MFS transporter [Acidobacteriota bacterium]
MWEPLRLRDFRLVWAGSAVSLVGDQFFIVAVPWVVLALTQSALQVGTVMMLSALPRAAFMLLGGAVTDRVPPRSITFYSNLLRGLLVGALAFAEASGALRIAHLYALALVFGLVDAFAYPAFQTLLTMLVPGDRLPAANSLMQSTAQLGALVGPAAAGAVVAAAGAAPAFGVDAMTFLFAALMLYVMAGGRGLAGGGAAVARPPSQRLLDDVRQGLLVVWRYPPARGLILLMAGVSLATAGPSTVGLATVAQRRFGGAAGFGVMLSALGAGALAGALLAGAVRQARRRGPTWLAISALVGLCLAGLGVTASVPQAAALLAAIGAGSGFINVVFVSWLASVTPADLLGRVTSVVLFASVGLTPVSYLLAGLLAEGHPALMFFAAGVLVALVVVLAAADPAVRAID